MGEALVLHGDVPRLLVGRGRVVHVHHDPRLAGNKLGEPRAERRQDAHAEAGVYDSEADSPRHVLLVQVGHHGLAPPVGLDDIREVLGVRPAHLAGEEVFADVAVLVAVRATVRVEVAVVADVAVALARARLGVVVGVVLVADRPGDPQRVGAEARLGREPQIL